ncbi:MAG: hypothetical protein KAS22_09205, partial [Candidatus Heimdallarchaeota archaeon]|nr:hypothetical protein [Candidatus Heimdallarchaeota archaeon]
MSDEKHESLNGLAASDDKETNEISDDNKINDDADKIEPKQKKLFWLISTGSNSSQLILLNFFQYFAAKIVTQGVLGYVTAIRNLL